MVDVADGDITSVFSQLSSVMSILLVGPKDIRAKLAEGLRKAYDEDQLRGNKSLKIFHVDSLEQVVRDLREDEPKMFIHYVIIAANEGTEAMGIAKNELSKLDAQYLRKDSVQIVNWKIQGAKNVIRTPNTDVANLMSSSGAMVNQITGDNQEHRFAQNATCWNNAAVRSDSQLKKRMYMLLLSQN
ncbi:unnamed protein product [Allacma fusca]|uniref:Uncharacterized protein n=1 Tax=Allacma fusca TaxID=39272 RepID=A0A8J2MAI0_9HEXA|nr:unnamed protein product [Allacma fusca]